MKERLLQYAEKIDGMELRQRVLLLVGGVVLLFVVADTLALQPVYEQQQRSKQHIEQIENKLDMLRLRSGMLAGDDSGNSEYRGMLDTLAALDARIEAQTGTLLDPDQAIEVLEQVLAEEQGLTLSAATAAVVAPDDAAADRFDAIDNDERDNMPQLSRYRISLELEGSYLATLRYLQALERLPWTFHWEGIEYEVIEHPRAQVTLHLYTLGYTEDTVL